MLKFLRYVSLVGVGLLLLAWVLDGIYTSIYRGTKTRTPYQVLRTQEDVTSDFVFIGSSRVYYHVDPVQIEEATGLSGSNLTRPGCGSDETLLLTKLFFASGRKAKRMFFQVDDSWDQQTPIQISMAAAMPYLEEPLFADHYKDRHELWPHRYVPFFRYAQFSPDIGYREAAMSILKDDGGASKGKGFEPLVGDFRGVSMLKLKLKSARNPKLEEVVALCEANQCEPHFFTAPFFNFEGADFGVFLETRLPNYVDFSRELRDQAYFRDVSHMNVAGAKKFTDMVVDEWFTR